MCIAVTSLMQVTCVHQVSLCQTLVSSSERQLSNSEVSPNFHIIVEPISLFSDFHLEVMDPCQSEYRHLSKADC